MNNILNFFTSIIDGENPIVTWISVGAIALLIALLVIVCISNRGGQGFDTKRIVFAGICIATSFGLSFLKFSPVTYGGSITIASMVPIMLYSYIFGPISGIIGGLIYGLLQFIQSPYLFTGTTFLLDFPLAFASICLVGLFRKLIKNELGGLIAGVGFTYIWRFLAHLLSGFIYFANGGIWANLPADNMFIYSFLYQITYIGPDFIISLVVIIALYFSKTITRLEKIADKKA